MQVEQKWNFDQITAEIEEAKKKLRECPTIFYKKGVLKTTIGASVLVISALALSILRAQIFIPNSIFRDHLPITVLISVTVLMYSSIISVFWSIHGLYLLHKSRSIEKGKDKEINYIKETINQLEIFLQQLDKTEKLINENNKKQLKDYLDNLHKICKVTLKALVYKKELSISIFVLNIKNDLVSIKDICKELLNVLNSVENKLNQAQIKIELIFDIVEQVNFRIETYIKYINKLDK